MYTIIWLLYIVIIFYNIIDAWQTILLLRLGASELNPILNYFIKISGTDYSIFAVKFVPILVLGLGITLYRKQIQEE